MAINEDKSVPQFLNNKQQILLFLWSKHNQNEIVYSKDIQELLRIEKSYASSLLTELERDNFIVRKRDGRRKEVRISEAGIRLVEDTYHYFESQS